MHMSGHDAVSLCGNMSSYRCCQLEHSSQWWRFYLDVSYFGYIQQCDGDIMSCRVPFYNSMDSARRKKTLKKITTPERSLPVLPMTESHGRSFPHDGSHNG